MLSNLAKLYSYKELLYNLALREIKSKYKQTMIGIGWVVFQPLVMMLVFTAVFSYFAKVKTGDVPYPLFSYCGLVVWAFFSNSVLKGMSSIISNINLVTKTYFPREILPLSAIISSFVDFLVACLLFLLLVIFYGIPFTGYILMVPLILIIQIILVTGLSLFLSAFNVFKRDAGYVVPIGLQVWMFLSPIVYPVNLVPENYKTLYMLNPVACIVEGYRSSILYGQMPSLRELGWAAVVSVVILVAAYIYFKKAEMKFADII